MFQLSANEFHHTYLVMMKREFGKFCRFEIFFVFSQFRLLVRQTTIDQLLRALFSVLRISWLQCPDYCIPIAVYRLRYIESIPPLVAEPAQVRVVGRLVPRLVRILRSIRLRLGGTVVFGGSGGGVR